MPEWFHGSAVRSATWHDACSAGFWEISETWKRCIPCPDCGYTGFSSSWAAEHSGWISGGPRMLRIDFTPEGLTKFVAEWENESGQSRDPRFQCYIHPYDRWYQKYGRWIPVLRKPLGIGKTVLEILSVIDTVFVHIWRRVPERLPWCVQKRRNLSVYQRIGLVRLPRADTFRDSLLRNTGYQS